MCGGRGMRLDIGCEKPLLSIAGRPMLDRVLDALHGSQADRVHAVASPHTPRTRAWLQSELDGVDPTSDSDLAPSLIDAPGDGYVADLEHALDHVDPPILTVAADLPLLRSATVDRVLDRHAGGDATVCVPRALPAALGASVGRDAALDDAPDRVATGVNVVSPEAEAPPDRLVLPAPDLAVNVNTARDARIADHLLDRDAPIAALVDPEVAT
jgi:adenosylcobinamide-phosphate guanylyltransferase